MKKIISVICLVSLLATLLLLVGCGCGGDEVPPDHQLASKPAVDGYTLYIPEEWEFQRKDGIITAHVSAVNTTSFVAARVSTAHTDMAAYWAESEAELIDMMEPLSRDPEGLDGTFVSSYKLENSGTTLLEPEQGGKLAYFYEYTGIPATKVVRYRFLQYFILVGATPADGMIVLTLSGSDEVKETTGDKDFNDNMREKMMRMLDVIVIGQPTESEGPADLSYADEDAPEGMKNATLNKHLGMTVYVPDGWRVPESDGVIRAVAPDAHANITVTNLSVTGGVGVQNTIAARMAYYGIEQYNPELGFTLIDYWNLFRADCNAYFDEGTFTVLSEPTIVESTDAEGNKVYDVDPPPTVAGETTYYTYHITGVHRGELYEISFYVFRATKDTKNQFRTLSLMTHDATHMDYVPTAEQMLEEVRY